MRTVGVINCRTVLRINCMQIRIFSDFLSQTRMAFICHSVLALSPAQNGQESAIKSLPQQKVAMTKHAFRRWYSFTYTTKLCSKIIVFLSDNSSVAV